MDYGFLMVCCVRPQNCLGEGNLWQLYTVLLHGYGAEEKNATSFFASHNKVSETILHFLLFALKGAHETISVSMRFDNDRHYETCTGQSSVICLSE